MQPACKDLSAAPCDAQETSALDRQIIDGARELVARDLVIGTVGNVSARAGGSIRITPTRTPYRDMDPADLVTVDLETGASAGDRRPSRELPVHLAVYRASRHVGAVVHTHSQYATAWSFLGAPLEPATEEMAYYGIGAVRTTEPAPSGSLELARSVTRGLGDSRAVLLGRHGVLAVGPTVESAIVVARAVEHQACVAWLLRTGRTPAR